MAAIAYVQCFAVVAFAVTDIARHVHVWQEMHLHLDHAVALAGLAAAAFDVEGKAARIVAARACFRHACKQLAYGREKPRVSGGIAAWRAPNRALVYCDDLVEQLQPFDTIER